MCRLNYSTVSKKYILIFVYFTVPNGVKSFCLMITAITELHELL